MFIITSTSQFQKSLTDQQLQLQLLLLPLQILHLHGKLLNWQHNLSVQLVNNDHTPVIPIVYSQVNVTSTAPILKTMGIDSVTIDLMKDISFNTGKIIVPAGYNVAIRFDNQDANIPHNVAIYTDNTAEIAIFKGEIILGLGEIDYTFDAPATPGTYFFRCDIHPQMNGQFVVH
jgi:plastocyanin